MNRLCKLRKSPHDPRDYIHQPERPMKASVKNIDLSSKMPAVLDQLELPTCASNAASNALKYLLMCEKKNAIQPSRLYIDYVARVLIEKHSPDDNNGVCIRDICKAIQKYYVCDEKIYPYLTANYAKPPSLEIFRAASLYKKVMYSAVPQNIVILKTTLSNAQPIMIGITLYSSFMSGQVANTGIIPMPNLAIENTIGASAGLLVGFDDNTRMFKVMMSWGGEWADEGYCYLSYDYVMNPFLAFEFWVLKFY
jgi:C1A family cysteine protease